MVNTVVVRDMVPGSHCEQIWERGGNVPFAAQNPKIALRSAVLALRHTKYD
jgi:hypothetical protein